MVDLGQDHLSGTRPRIGNFTDFTTTILVPNEIVSGILRYSTKLDMKNARLVSKSWCESATKYLFDTIYISPREKDIEIFLNITRKYGLSFQSKSVQDVSQSML